MIFLTIGTHEPFDRLVQAMDAWCAAAPPGQEILAQVIFAPSGGYRPQHFNTIERLAPDAYETAFSRADLVVSHAGMGTILTALTLGKPVVILPRRGHLRETRNDHQYMTAQQLGTRPGIFVAEDEAGFDAAMTRALAATREGAPVPISPVAPPGFTDALRRFLIKPGAT